MQDDAANPGLQVLLRDPRPGALESACEDLLERTMGRLDGEVEQLNPQRLRHQPGVLDALRRRVARRHPHRDHVFGAKGIGGYRCGEGGVDSA